ncbi:hypothetical protein Srufu_046530 [Streptomyces libani subsp. rufus]|nr:hypothetical protein Srufu_046530 [Streptomyces libani subsp. rufus]
MARKDADPDSSGGRHRGDVSELAADPGTNDEVADEQLEHERAEDGDSETLVLLRARVHEDYARRQQYGPLGRSL